jgi:integrase
MWATQFPRCQPAHFVFPHEKYDAAGEENRFGFTAGAVVYDTDPSDPSRPIGNWKEAWEKAKERAGEILAGKREEEESEPLQCRFHDLRHTAVTRLLEAGIPYPVVASIMGWSAATAIRMAKRYGHIGNQALRAAADVLGGSDPQKVPKVTGGR